MKRISRKCLVGKKDFDKKPEIQINSGDRLLVETTTPEKEPNLTGPIMVKGLGVGDTLAITIEQIDLKDDGILFFASSNEHWGGLLSEYATRPIEKRISIVEGKVVFSETISFPTKPMVGWIALMNSTIGYDPCDHGGNMDIKELQQGATIYLYDKEGSGKFLLGDVHAAMGDGEVCGTGIEISADVTIRVDVIKETKEHRPIILTNNSFITIATRKSHREASKQAVLDMVHYLMKSQKLSFEEANTLLSAIGDLRISSVVSHVQTYKMIVDRKYITDTLTLIKK